MNFLYSMIYKTIYHLGFLTLICSFSILQRVKENECCDKTSNRLNDCCLKDRTRKQTAISRIVKNCREPLNHIRQSSVSLNQAGFTIRLKKKKRAVEVNGNVTSLNHKMDVPLRLKLS